MIQGFTQDWTVLGRRRVSAVLLAICLNLALVPCTMALEVVEQGHDCCPPEIQIESSECCELDDASVDARSGKLELDDSPDQDALPSLAFSEAFIAAPARHPASVDPPDPPGYSPPLYDLYCSYLK